ncbi:hypothetical protein [Enterococcus casseliflavus]|uniref:hypothetical protein n=1 Tax=Enterococcus casseliflavus TaxID=37734 RepID=UPI001F2C7C18|nr:hypothetical protein [Enterococcus casseliflavus]
MANKQETTYWREQTNLIEQQFNEKNRQFFDDFRSYLLLSSLFYDEHKVTEQVYAIAMDLLEAQTHGKRRNTILAMIRKGWQMNYWQTRQRVISKSVSNWHI